MQPDITSLSAKEATGVGTPVPVAQTQNIAVTMIGANDSGPTAAVGTVKIRASFLAGVDLTAPSTASNPWFYVALFDYNTQGVILGTTGVVFAANGINGYHINANEIKQVAPEVTAYTSGAFTVIVSPVNNQ